MALNMECIGKKHEPYSFDYTDRDVILYALGVGADENQLRYVYEGDANFCTIPTFAVVPANRALFEAVAEMGADLTRLLHGEQAIRWHAPIPTSGTILTSWEVTGIYDKGKGALAVVSADSTDSKGRPLFTNVITLFIRGEGGFGGDPGPRSEPLAPPAGKAPDFTAAEPTLKRQALVYRLSGDRNPLHASPEFAAAAGFERPILHGLCTLGFAARAFVNDVLEGDVSRLKYLSARFSAVVFPGDVIVTRGWKAGGDRWILDVATERDPGKPVVTNFVCDIA